MAVNSSYRNRGIATEMMKVRPMLLKALNLKVAHSHFVGIAGQNAAMKACYEENLVLTYDELFEIDSNLHFAGIEHSTVKIMSLTIN
jgi:hypothetical protein